MELKISSNMLGLGVILGIFALVATTGNPTMLWLLLILLVLGD